MTVRVDLKNKRVYRLDDVIPVSDAQWDYVEVEDLDPPIPERVALLRVAEVGDVIKGVGIKIGEDSYIVEQL